MPASVRYLDIDAPDPERLARSWYGLLDVGVETTIGDGQFVVRWVEPRRKRELEGFRWRGMADPEDNESDFDLVPAG